MSIIQALVGSIVSSGSGGGGGGPPPGPAAYPPTLTAGGGSFYFQNSVSSYLALTENQADWAVGTGDYTIEWQQWMLDTSSTVCRPFSLGTWPNAYLALSLENGYAIFWGQGGGSNNLVGSWTYTPANIQNTWVHIAISRESGTTRIYFNGQLQWSTNVAYDVTTNDNLYIGNQSSLDAGFSGYIKDFRFIKGVGLYTTNFATPLEPLAETGQTVALFSMSDFGSRFADSTGRHNTTSGGLSYEDIGPYALTLLIDTNNTLSYDPNSPSAGWNDLSSQDHDVATTLGGFNGNGQYYIYDTYNNGSAVADSSVASVQNNLTPRISMSFWANIATNNNFQHIAGFRSNDMFHVLLLNASTVLECRIQTGGGTAYWDLNPNISGTVNAMAHYAFVANGNRVDFYVNGVSVTNRADISGVFTGQLGAFSIAKVLNDWQATGLKIGYARVDNRARSPEEIAREYNATKATYGY